MQLPIDVSRFVGRQSRIETRHGWIDGTIVAVGARGVDITSGSTTARIPARDVRNIRPAA